MPVYKYFAHNLEIFISNDMSILASSSDTLVVFVSIIQNLIRSYNMNLEELVANVNTEELATNVFKAVLAWIAFKFAVSVIF